MNQIDLERPIILIGFKSSGKTSVGLFLSQLWQMSFIDTDRLLEEKYLFNTGQSLLCSQIYRVVGEKVFRDLEEEVIEELKIEQNTIVASGGGVVLNDKNRLKLQTLGVVVYLYTSHNILLKRLSLSKAPAYIKNNLNEEFKAQFLYREPLYRKCADYIISTDSSSVDKVALQIESLHRR